MSQKSLLTILQGIKTSISEALADGILDSSLIDQLAWQFERCLGLFNDASLLDDLTECLVAYINLISTYSTFQADHSTRAHKQAVFKYISVLNVLTSIPSLENLLLPSVTPFIINILCDPSITDICGMEILRFFNNIARSTNKAIRYEIGITSPFHIHKLVDTLSVCGCLEYQMLILESIFLICSIEQVGELSKGMFPEASSLEYAIRTFNVKEFDRSARSFLNILNNTYRNITSIVVDKVFLDKQQILEPVDVNNHQHPLWVDFNKNSIGIYCKRDSLTISQSSQDTEVVGWELLTIFYKDIVNTVHVRSKIANSPVTFFKFFLKNELHVMFASSSHLTSSRVLSLVCFNDATIAKMKDKILPLISQNAFEEYTEDSTESSSLVLDRPGTYINISRINPDDRKSIPSSTHPSEKSLYKMFEVRHHNDGQADHGRQIAGAQPVPDSTVDDMLLNIRKRCQNIMNFNSSSTVAAKSPTHPMQLPFKHKKHRNRSQASSRILESIIESNESSSCGSSPRDEETDSSDAVNINLASNEATCGAITQTQQNLLEKQKDTAAILKGVPLQNVEPQQAFKDKTIESQRKGASINHSSTIELADENKTGRSVSSQDSISSEICSETDSDTTVVQTEVVYNTLRSVPITMNVLNEVNLLEDNEDLELQEKNIGNKIIENDISTNEILSQKETFNKGNEKMKKICGINKGSSTELDHEPSQETDEVNKINEHIINQGIEKELHQKEGNFKVKETVDACLEFACDEEVIIIDDDIENQEATERVEDMNDDGINIEEQRNSNKISKELSQNKKSKRYLKEVSKSSQEVGKENTADEVITNRNRKQKSKQPLTKNSNIDKEKLLDDTYLKTEVEFPYCEEIIILDDDIQDEEVTEKAEGMIEKREGIEKIVDENNTSQNKEEKTKQLSARSDNIEHHKGSDVSSSQLIQGEAIQQDVDNQERTKQGEGVSNECENRDGSLEVTENDGISAEKLEKQNISDDIVVDLQVPEKTSKTLEDGNVLESNIEQPTKVQIIERDNESNKNQEKFPTRNVTSQEVQEKSAVKSKNKVLKSRKTKKVTNNVPKDDNETKLDKVQQTKKATKRTNKLANESNATAIRRSARNVRKSPEKNANKTIVEEVSVGDSKQILSRDTPKSLPQQLVEDDHHVAVQEIVDNIEPDDDIVSSTPPLPQTHDSIISDKIMSRKRIENIEVCGETVSIECPSQLSGQSTVLVEQHQNENNTNVTGQLSPISGQSTVPVSQQNAEEDEPANGCGNYEVILSDGELEEETVKKPTHSARQKLDFKMHEDIIKRAFDPKYNMVFSYLQSVQQHTEEVRKLETSEYVQKADRECFQKPVAECAKPTLRLKRKLYNPNVESELSLTESMPSDSFNTETDESDRAKKTKPKQVRSKVEENRNKLAKGVKKAAYKEPKKKTKLVDTKNQDEGSIRIPEVKNSAGVQETTKDNVYENLEMKANVRDTKDKNKQEKEDSKDKENESDGLNEEITGVFSKRGGIKNKSKDARSKLEDEVNQKLPRIFRSISEDSSDGTPQNIIVEAMVHDVPLKYRENDNIQVAKKISPTTVQVEDTVKRNKQEEVEKILLNADAIIEVNEEIPPIIKTSQIADAVKEKQDQANENQSQTVNENLVESTFDLIKKSLNESDILLEKPQRKRGRKKITKPGEPAIVHGKVTKPRFRANRSRRQLQDSLVADLVTNDYVSFCENNVKSYIDRCEKKALLDGTFVSKVQDFTLDNMARGGYEERGETLPWRSFSNLFTAARKRKVRPLSSSDSEDDLQEDVVTKRSRIHILQNITLQKPRAALEAGNEDTILYDSLISDSIRGIRALILLADRNIPQTDKWLKYRRMLKELKGIFKNYSDIC